MTGLNRFQDCGAGVNTSKLPASSKKKQARSSIKQAMKSLQRMAEFLEKK